MVLILVTQTVLGENNQKNLIVRNGDVYTLTLADLSFSVSASIGGRIISFQRGGHEILSTSIVHSVYYGSTLWLSPQSDYWPQYPSIDKLPYKANILRNKLRLTSITDSINGIRVIKEFTFSLKDTAILINYIIKNISNKAKQLAPWDVTRVAGGLSFFPVGEVDAGNTSNVKNTSEKNGILWFAFVPDALAEKQKLYSTNRAGWIAHCYKNLLFVKCFPNIPPPDAPPGQGETEIFVAPSGSYIELENHGSYKTLLPKRSLKYSEKWFLFNSQDFLKKDKALLIQRIEKLNKEIK